MWYIIEIVSSSPTDFHSEKIGLESQIMSPVSIRVKSALEVTFTQFTLYKGLNIIEVKTSLNIYTFYFLFCFVSSTS